MSEEKIPIELIKPALQQLTDLLTISSTLVDSYYDLFLNPEPIQYVYIKAYGSDGTIMDLAIPNLAYLRQNCIVGSGSPEGVTPASLGTFYLDRLDKISGLYVKTGDISSDSTTGWIQLTTIDRINKAMDTIDKLIAELINSIDTHNYDQTAHPYLIHWIEELQGDYDAKFAQNESDHEQLQYNIDHLLPAQSGNNYTFLMTTGSTLRWEAIDTQVKTSLDSGNKLTWGKAYKLGTVSSLTISGFNNASNRHYQSHYENTFVEFTCGQNNMTVSVPANTVYNYNMTPTFTRGITYRITFDTVDGGSTKNAYIAQRTWGS